MSTWGIACLVLGMSVACWWAYCVGRAQGYNQGYTAGKTDGRRTQRSISAQRLGELTQQLGQVVDQSRDAERAVDYLYQKARLDIEQFDFQPTPDGSKRP